MSSTQRTATIVGMVTMVAAALALVLVGILNQAPVFVISGAALFVAGGTTFAATAARGKTRR